MAAIAGNAMEWYDFTVFALMTPVIKNLFFPVDPKLPGSEINALLLTTALLDRKSTRLNSSHRIRSRMPSSA